jgi:hypothetical protein
MALDRGLSRGGVRLEDFAKRWKVDEKTVRRDLKMFRQLGYIPVSQRLEEGTYSWFYYSEDRPIFTANDRPRKN